MQLIAIQCTFVNVETNCGKIFTLVKIKLKFSKNKIQEKLSENSQIIATNVVALFCFTYLSK